MASTKAATSLVASGNTYNPCLLVLRRKGYDLWLEEGDGAHLWCARKGKHSFMGYTAPELLGLVTLFEELGKDWNQQEPDIYEELLDQMEE